MSFVLAAISSFAWSVFDLSRKKLVNHFSALGFLFFLSIIQAVLFYIIIIFTGEELIIAKQYFWTFIASIASVFFAHIAFLKAIKWSQFSSVIPLLSCIPIFSIIFSIFILDEWLSLRQITGGIIIVIASFFVQSSEKGGLRLEKGSWYMILSAGCWALTSIFSKQVLVEVPKLTLFFEQNLMIAIFLLGYFLFKSPKELLVKWTGFKISFLSLAVLSSMGALFFQFWSIETLFVGVFEAFKQAISLLLTLFFAKMFLQEHISKKKILSIIVMISGVFLISI
ncbi:MAG: DMT family transporter [Bdellovibrionaceae bacterium]|nr:DMT family transporter [Pseudobdellovibrionaceae bacterium]